MTVWRLASVLGAKKKSIAVMCREKNEQLEETVFGEDFLRLAYGTPMGLKLMSKMFAHECWSRALGVYYDSRLSRQLIKGFVKKLEIDVEECVDSLLDFRSFNDFFARRLKSECRPIAPDTQTLISPGDGRLLVFPRITEETLTYVKWAPVHLMDLFNRDPELVERYRNGSCAVLRLCPADYHRFHFPVSGTVGPTQTVPGLLHSVNPYALEQKVPVYALNKRKLCWVDSEDFGRILIVEVGAFGVGGIIQTHQSNSRVNRGEEKGYFKFGGSTVLLFIENGRLEFDEDLVRHSNKGVETIVKFGEVIAAVAKP